MSMEMDAAFQELCRVGVALCLCNEEKLRLDFSVVQNEKLGIFQKGLEGGSGWPGLPLYLADGAENHHNVSTHCALTGQVVNLHDVYDEQGFDFSGARAFDRAAGYHSRSMLLVPMTDRRRI